MRILSILTTIAVCCAAIAAAFPSKLPSREFSLHPSFVPSLGGQGPLIQLYNQPAFSPTGQASKQRSDLIPSGSLPNLSTKPQLKPDDVQVLPPGFKPGSRFIPPTYDPLIDIQSSRGNIGSIGEIDINAAVGQLDRAGCVPPTTTIEIYTTSVYPVSEVDVVTKTVTSYLPDLHYRITSAVVVKSITNTIRETVISTVVNQAQDTTTQTKYAPARTLTSTLVKTVTAFVEDIHYTTHTDTIIHTSIEYITQTVASTSVSIISIPITQTSYVQLPGATQTFVQIVTSTLAYDNFLPPRIDYEKRTVQATETVTGVQRLRAESIVRTTTVFVPSYTTVIQTSYGTRTQTSWSTVIEKGYETVTAISTVVRIGYNKETATKVSTIYSTTNKYESTDVPSYVYVTVTKDIPTTVIESTTVYEPVVETVTVASPETTTTIYTQSLVQLVETFTNILSTPVVYSTKTVYGENCRQK